MSAVEALPRKSGWVVIHTGVVVRSGLDREQAEKLAEELAQRWNATLRIGFENGGARETHRHRLTGGSD